MKNVTVYIHAHVALLMPTPFTATASSTATTVDCRHILRYRIIEQKNNRI